MFQILLLRSQLLIDDSDAVWNFLSEQKSGTKIIDLVQTNVIKLFFSVTDEGVKYARVFNL
jgi:hypothetical protein